MFRFVWIAWGDMTNWGVSAPSATWAECMEFADLYLAEGMTVSLCFLGGS